jgi:hypothetical protein
MTVDHINPVAFWSITRLAVTLAVAFVVLAASGRAIMRNDEKLASVRTLVMLQATTSATLEWVRTPSRAHAIVEAYDHADRVPTVTRGTLIDTFLFVPAYVTVLATACFWAARVLTDPWTTIGLALGWGAVVAGGLDLIENAGILVEVRRGWVFAAPLTNAVCLAKWTLVVTCALFALATLVSRPFAR